MFDAVPYLSNELVDPLGGYAELSSRFASCDGWLEKAEACSSLVVRCRFCPVLADTYRISASSRLSLANLSRRFSSSGTVFKQVALIRVMPGDCDVMNRCVYAG